MLIMCILMEKLIWWSIYIVGLYDEKKDLNIVGFEILEEVKKNEFVGNCYFYDVW